MAKAKLNFSEIVEKGSEHWEDIFINEFRNESDRGAVLIALSYIDELLEIAIKRKLVTVDEKNKDTLFEPNSPLGSLSSKIALSYRLGLISNEFQTSLNKLREIRNDFAHSFHSLTLSHSNIKDKVNSLYKRFKKLHDFEHLNFPRFGNDERGKLLIMINWLTFKLMQSIVRIDCIKPKPIEFAFWDEELEKFFYSIIESSDSNKLNEEYKKIIANRKKS